MSPAIQEDLGSLWMRLVGLRIDTDIRWRIYSSIDDRDPLILEIEHSKYFLHLNKNNKWPQQVDLPVIKVLREVGGGFLMVNTGYPLRTV